MVVIVDIQGFKLSDGEFIAKEIGLFYRDTDIAERILLKKPFNFSQLKEKDKKQVRWLERNYHGLKWSDGVSSVQYVEGIFNSEIKNSKIYVKGSEKKEWLVNNLSLNPDSIIDLDISSCTNFQMLRKNFNTPCCGRHKGICAIQNIALLLIFLLSQKNFEI